MTEQTDADTAVDAAANGQDTEDVMERMMAVQEEDERQEQLVDQDGRVDGDAGNAREGGERDFDDQNPMDIDLQEEILNRTSNFPRRSFLRLHYTSISFIIAAVHVIYVLRTRKQAYLALLYLTSSKLSYIVIGNMTLAAFIGLFYFTIKTFLNGLRLMETETIVDHIRWNVTETCIALTMFRQEINVKIMGIFLVLILGKCLHWAVELRANHLRMTEEIFYFVDEEDELLMGDINGRNDENQRESPDRHVWWLWRSIGFFVPKSLKDAAYDAHQGMPRARKKHLKLFALMNILYVFDVLSLTYCVSHILEDGPSVFIMFLFETSILFTSIISNIALFMLHAVDSMLNILQKVIVERHQTSDDNENDGEEDPGDSVRAQNRTTSRSRDGKQSFIQRTVQRLASFWRDYRVTATFVIELMALAAKFLFHLILFIVVFTLYGLPINIIRDFYLAFRRLRERLLAFASYRRLTSNMNTRFEAVVNEEELDAAGRTCIICRDAMEVDGIHGDCIKLPICEHIFHKHCLREWLVQQQSCPTCRGDLLRNEARARTLREQRDEQEDNSAENNGDMETGEKEEKKSNTKPPCPCLYKVNSAMGASLYEINEEDKCNGVAERKVLKTLSQGTLIVCIDVQVFTCASTTGNNSTSIYLRTPGGWISRDDLEHIVELKPNPDASPESLVAQSCS